MKKFIIFLYIFLIAITVNAEIMDIPFTPEEFDVDIYEYPYMILIDNPVSEQLDTQYTFTDEESSYQIRYTFFKQTVEDYKDIRMAYSAFILAVIWNVAGYETDDILVFNDNDVEEEFNGDFGCTVFIIDPKSDFGEGFKYIMLNSYYKNNQGIVVQSILFNDLNFPENENFMDIFHSFRFHE